jgi:hypothetical protein
VTSTRRSRSARRSTSTASFGSIEWGERTGGNVGGLDRYPRLGFKRDFDERSREAARRGPRTRVALAYRAGFGRMIARAPFDE